MSCQHITEGVQAQAGGVGRPRPLAQTLGEQLDNWPRIKSKGSIQRELLLLWPYSTPVLAPNPTLEPADVSW